MVMSSAQVRGWNYQPLNTRIAHECWKTSQCGRLHSRDTTLDFDIAK